MDNGYNSNITLENDKVDVTILKTDEGMKNGQDKCPKCGATDISMNIDSGRLRCNFCRYEFDPIVVADSSEDLKNLRGNVIGTGATDIASDSENIITLKCESCGAEVVVDTSEALNTRCHWCRNVLTINQQIPNGAVPDIVLPFSVTKDAAKFEIEKFVSKRKFFAHPTFQKEFTTNNIMGVYFPYMLVDVNAHANFIGKGEHEVRKYTRGSGDHKETYYDADLYHVEREFDIIVDDLTIESSADKLNNISENKTNNVINSIMPFDTENCVKWNANYLRGYSSEKRDVNIEQLKDLVNRQTADVVRFAANPTLTKYDRGVAWAKQDIDIKGQQWKAAYLPVWLYSYQQVSGNDKILHYVAVNARTKETMGSVPINKTRLFFVSFLIELLCIFITFSLLSSSSESEGGELIFLVGGFLFYFIMHRRYRNNDARHNHETETKTQISNLVRIDRLITTRTGLRNSSMHGANNTDISGSTVDSNSIKIFDNFTKK